MVLVIPRPAIRKRENRNIEKMLQLHFKRMKEYTDRGVDFKTASAAAMADLKNEKKERE
jgi:hypothetical protein